MNYYEHHIGDWVEATSHLSILEDGAYSRLVRKYYALERPLPCDMAAVQRLVGARSKDEKEAVENVLREFFELREDGWHQSRCDEEIREYLDREPEREVRRTNEAERLKRHRLERSRMFDALHKVGQFPNWNVSMTELRAFHKQFCDGTETQTGNVSTARTETAPETPATRTQRLPSPQSPIPSPQSPDSNLGITVVTPSQVLNTDSSKPRENRASVESEPSTATGSKPGESEIPSAEVVRVFDHWRSVHGHETAKLDAKRKKLIREALRLYGEADICRSLSGYKNSPHHMGTNDRNTVYDSIELLLKDAKHIDAGLRFHANPPRTDLSAQTQRIINQTEDWLPPEMRNDRK